MTLKKSKGTPVLLRLNGEYVAGKLLLILATGEKTTITLAAGSYDELLAEANALLVKAEVPLASVGIYTYFAQSSYDRHK